MVEKKKAEGNKLWAEDDGEGKKRDCIREASNLNIYSSCPFFYLCIASQSEWGFRNGRFDGNLGVPKA